MLINPINHISYRNTRAQNPRAVHSQPLSSMPQPYFGASQLSPLAKMGAIVKVELGGHLETLFSKETIQARVQELAKQINQDYKGKQVYIICVMNGAKRFSDDLAAAIGKKVNGTIKLKSYDGTESTGMISLVNEDLPDIDKADHILIIEDIVDTGTSMNFLTSLIKNKYAPESLKLCTLLDKPSRRKKAVNIDYTGFKIDDKFVIGYGLDYNEKGRELDDIYQVIIP